MKKALIAIVIPYLITGCATTYHQKNLFGGYYEQKIEEGIYNVGFDSNFFTSGLTIENYINYRCAEIVIKEGYNYFLINSIEHKQPQPRSLVSMKMYKDKPSIDNVRDANQILNNINPKRTKKVLKVLFYNPYVIASASVFILIILGQETGIIDPWIIDF